MTSQTREKLSCCLFFAAPSVAYGALSARMPAIKHLVGANDGQMGTLLLFLGLATLLSLLVTGLIIDKYGAKKLAVGGVLLLTVSFTLACAWSSYYILCCGCVLAGFGVGLCDVSMNALGIELEKKYKILCLSFLHAISSLGGVGGALGASFCAFLGLSPFYTFALMLGLIIVCLPWANRHAPDTSINNAAAVAFKGSHIPVFVIICAILGLLCHVAEGAAAEWGSLLLHEIKGAPAQQAGLVFAFFTASMVICRLWGDHLRLYLKDWIIFLAGSLLGALGMAMALLFSWPYLCLAGYAVMGFGLGPIVPILFSRAGATSNISAGHASAVVSVFSYAGLLVFPPVIGYFAQLVGLVNALWSIPVCCLFMAAGASSLIVRQKK